MHAKNAKYPLTIKETVFGSLFFVSIWQNRVHSIFALSEKIGM